VLTMGTPHTAGQAVSVTTNGSVTDQALVFETPVTRTALAT
jgi:hypothetical protein